MRWTTKIKRMIENENFFYITQEDEERERVERKRDRRKGKWETSQDMWDENRERMKKKNPQRLKLWKAKKKAQRQNHLKYVFA